MNFDFKGVTGGTISLRQSKDGDDMVLHFGKNSIKTREEQQDFIKEDWKVNFHKKFTRLPGGNIFVFAAANANGACSTKDELKDQLNHEHGGLYCNCNENFLFSAGNSIGCQGCLQSASISYTTQT